MESSKDTDSEVFSLLQPELLTESELREILTSRCVSRNLLTFNKSQLVELFRNVALPLPQREYTGTSWREKRLSKKQRRTKRSITISHDDSSSSKLEPAKKVPRLSDDSSSSQSRLKPPVDLINFNKKVIKLSDSQKKDNKLDKIIIKDKSRESTIKDKSTASTIKDKSMDSTVKHKSTESTIKDKSTETTIKDKSTESTIKDRSTESTIKDKSRASTGKQDVSKPNGNDVSSSKDAKSSSSVVKLKRDPVSTKEDKLEDSKKDETCKKKRQKIVISW